MEETLTKKGLITKNKILSSARKLFYQNGYSDTSIRSITSDANVSLGLFNHCFDSKQDLACTILDRIWEEFDQLIEQYLCRDSLEGYLISSLCTMRLELLFPSYADLFLTALQESSFRLYLANSVIQIYEQVHPSVKSQMELNLLSNSIHGIQERLVSMGLNEPDVYSIDVLIPYYLQQYLHFLDVDSSLFDSIYCEYQKYYISLTDNFTPIFTKYA